MQIETLTPLKSLNPAYRKEKVSRQDIDRLKHELPLFLDRTQGKISESTLRDHLQTLLRGVAFPAADFLVQSEVRRMDTVIHDGAKRKDDIGVIIEAKTTENIGEMFSIRKPNVKSLHELVLYFMRERHAGNTAIKNLVITDGDALFVIADKEFERLFWDKKRFRKKILDADADAGKNNDLIYAAIKDHVAALDDTLTVTQTNLQLFRTYCEDDDQETDAKLIPLYKILSPEHLLRRPFAGDSNHLDKGFYRELLHIIGLHEVNKKNGKIVKSGGKKVIERLPEGQRHPASLLENTLQVATKENRFRKVKGLKDYGSNEEERHFSVALELCLTWVNRILFLKLLETQLSSYHQGDKAYRFLSPERIPDFDALNTLFFDVLNKPVAERESIVDDFARVPYLNSSLFEISELEDQVLRVNSLKDQFLLSLAPQSVLSTRGRAEELQPLSYLFRFLDAYDFGGEGKASIQEDNKRLINASVLGLIFEKINGYRDGSFYTPGFITEYMCRQTIRRAVVQKFRDDDGQFADFDADDFDALQNYLRRDNYKPAVRTAANALVNTTTVCDPAVGSGHFLVSALNELIATKSALGILGADAGARDVDIRAEVENDELLVSWRRDGEPYEYHVDVDSNGQLRIPPEVQAVQETLFQEKRTLIENCLFGVDLNPNSVKICRLRLWIELLKNAYYVLDERSGLLQTLPNIDINIKQGNSLISRFALDDDLSDALKDSNLTLADYRQAVTDYHRAQGRESKEQLLDVIDRIKGNFQTHISRNDKRVKDLAKARGQVQKLEGLLEMGDLFGSVDEKKVRKQLKPLQTKVAKLEAELTAVRDNAIYEQAFEWRFEFPAVLGEDGTFLGFDVVVGNPPYGIKFTTDLKNKLKIQYERIVERIPNSYAYFLGLAETLLSTDGIVSFIIPNEFLFQVYMTKARNFFISENRLIEAINLGDNVFSEATVPSCIVSVQNAMPSSKYSFLVGDLRGKAGLLVNKKSPLTFISSDTILGLPNAIFIFEQEHLSILSKCLEYPRLEDFCTVIANGISTGADNVYLIEAPSKEIRQSRLLKPSIKGGSIDRFVTPKNPPFHLLYVEEELHEFEDKEVYNYLFPHKEYLINKSVEKKKGSRSWEILFRSRSAIRFGEEKICIRQTSDSIVATIDTLGYYCIDSINVLQANSKEDHLAILAYLSSKLCNYIYQNISQEGGRALAQVKPSRIKALPFNSILISDEYKLILDPLVTNILAAKSADPAADTSALEAEIDVLVYKLYGLTHAEVLVVDPEFGLSEGEYGEIEVG